MGLDTIETFLIVMIVVLVAMLGALIPLYLGVRRLNDDDDDQPSTESRTR